MRARNIRIADFANVTAGGTPSRGIKKYYDGTIPWVKTRDLNFGTVVQTEEAITKEGLKSIRGDVNPPGTIMVAMYGGIGTIGQTLNAQLAAVEDARQAAQAQVKQADALLAAVYREAFCDVIPITVPSEFQNAPAGWHWTKLTDIARLESGHTPSRSRPDWWGGDISWVSLTEIRALDGRWVDETQIRTNPAGIAHSAARVLPRGTVCFSRTASVGFVTIMGKPMATSQDFANWVSGDHLDPEFLMHALVRARDELRALATGATHKTIHMPTLEAFHICAPDRLTQESIVKHLKEQLAVVEEIREGAQASLAEVQRLPARLLGQAFDFPDSVAREAATYS